MPHPRTNRKAKERRRKREHARRSKAYWEFMNSFCLLDFAFMAQKNDSCWRSMDSAFMAQKNEKSIQRWVDERFGAGVRVWFENVQLPPG